MWAFGECNGRGAFTHTAYHDDETVAGNLLHDDPRRVTDRNDCYALYVDPPLGRVGMTEPQVRESGRPALVALRPMTRVGRAVEKSETQGVSRGACPVTVAVRFRHRRGRPPHRTSGTGPGRCARRSAGGSGPARRLASSRGPCAACRRR